MWGVTGQGTRASDMTHSLHMHIELAPTHVLLLSEPQGRADKRLGDKRKVERVESKHIVRNADGIPMARSAAAHPFTPTQPSHFT